MSGVMARAAGIRLVAFDVDGVLTDGRLWFTAAGEELKVFDVRDGQGIKMLQDAGLALAIITSRRSAAVEQRARNLGIDLVFQGVHDKRAQFEMLLTRLGLRSDEGAFMGDDLVDLPVLRRCGLAITVPEASELVRRHAHYVTQAGGGRGAVREACELILQGRGALDDVLAPYLA